MVQNLLGKVAESLPPLTFCLGRVVTCQRRWNDLKISTAAQKSVFFNADIAKEALKNALKIFLSFLRIFTIFVSMRNAKLMQ